MSALAPAPPLIGRDGAVAALGAMLAAHRLVSIVGPGGVGKTSLAQALLRGASGATALLDLAALSDARDLLPALARCLGLPDGASGRERDLAQRFAALLAGRRLLVLLDGCEHMIEAAAGAGELLLAAAPGVTVLATSREALRADGERVYRLAPMALPAPDAPDPAAALASPAVRLFMQRAFGLRALAQVEVDPVVALCRGLDGLPLALELAAAMAPRVGLEALAARVAQGLPEAGEGGCARHLSLGTMLGWSYDLLLPAEQAVFRRLAVFRGGFTLEAAAAVAGAAGEDTDEVKEAVIGLVAKSLVTPAPAPGERLRLLDTTRAYAARLLAASGEQQRLHQRHAAYLADLLEAAHDDWLAMPRGAWLACYAPWLDDARAALDWALAPGGDGVLGVRLCALGFPLAEQAGAGLEFGVRVGQAIALLSQLGESLPLLQLRLAGFAWDGRSEGGGQVDAVLRAHANALRQGATAGGALMARWCASFGSGDYPGALESAHAMLATAAAPDDPVLALLGHKSLAQNLHFLGRHDEALTAARAALGTLRTIPLGYVASPVPVAVAMRIVMARTLWLRGDPVAAEAMCSEALACASQEQPIGLCHVLGLASVPIALWNRDPEAGARALEQLERHARRYSFGLWQRWSAHYRALLTGCPAPATADTKLADHLATFDPTLLTAAACARVATGTVGWCAPEVLRAHAEGLLLAPATRATAALPATLLARALALARQQGALAWELRVACSLVRLERRHDSSLARLEQVLARCPAGENADRRLARQLLQG